VRFGEFDGVRKQINDNLLQTELVKFQSYLFRISNKV
jgi:hypothetical protein